jgi:hypothetical protein
MDNQEMKDVAYRMIAKAEKHQAALHANLGTVWEKVIEGNDPRYALIELRKNLDTLKDLICEACKQWDCLRATQDEESLARIFS